MSVYRRLDQGWTVSAPSRPPIAAQVPGCVHLDLLAAGLIPDPYLGDNETRLGWIGRTDWVYETTFDWADDGHECVDLECDGLDTIATVTLNGTHVADTFNMHRRYRFPVRLLLRRGSNHLSITFQSVYRYTEEMEKLVGPRPASYDEPFNLVRKMACNFGWDWGPTLVTAGIWRPIGLRSWSVSRFAQVRPLATVSDGAGVIDVHVTLAGPADGDLRLKANDAEITVASGGTEAVVRVEVPNPRLWWPRGHGGQPLYDLAVSLCAGPQELDTWSGRVGFRTVRLDTTPDEHGTPYTVIVNDKPVFVRGVNWIPDDCFPARITRSRLEQRLTQACQANVNYLRVWGGGLYESEDFYAVADELGLMVGQDFLFSCAAYPEEEPLASEVEAEARDNVARLTAHPSLVVWTGNNECLWGHADWGWPQQLGGRTWGAGYYFGILPRVVAELDPDRPYWPGSPYSAAADRHPNRPEHGNTHIWDVWNTHDYTHYRSYTPRFVAEFGFQAPPTFTTLTKGEHQKAADGEVKLGRAMFRLPPPRDREDWLYYTQLIQARAITTAVTHFRSLMPVCMGTIVWQLNDCWPVTSWSAVDGEGRPKPMWYALRDAYASRLLTVQPGPRLVAVNDSPEQWRAEVPVSRVSLDGRPLAKAAVTVDAAPGSVWSQALAPEVSTPDDPRAELIVAGGAMWFFMEDCDIAYPRATWAAEVELVPAGYRVTIRAHTILRDLTLFPDRLDPAATADRALVTLLPGESAAFTVHTAERLDPIALSSWPVLRCLNDTA